MMYDKLPVCVETSWSRREEFLYVVRPWLDHYGYFLVLHMAERVITRIARKARKTRILSHVYGAQTPCLFVLTHVRSRSG